MNAHHEHAARLRAEDRLETAVAGLRKIANPNWTARATGADAREMASYAQQVINRIENDEPDAWPAGSLGARLGVDLGLDDDAA